jgi:hypothetical protein
MDFVGVDLLPVDGGWTVLELNGAVDFDRNYALSDKDPFVAALSALRIGQPISLQTLSEGKEGAMSTTLTGSSPRPGDEIVITGHAVGDTPRTAVILEVLGTQGHTRFRVKWEDGHESIYFPGVDAVIRSAKIARKHAAVCRAGTGASYCITEPRRRPLREGRPAAESDGGTLRRRPTEPGRTT